MPYTPEQLAAIRGRGKVILVSAAAGSGKTSVLVERIIRRVTAEENPESLRDFLVVTFTKAAAAEMRSRVAAAIGRALAENPSSAHLRRQLTLIPTAKIMTVHSFCLSLIRDNLHLLPSLPPTFRLLDEDEAALMRAEACENVLEAAYAAGGGAFAALCAVCCRDSGDERLQSLLLSQLSSLDGEADPDARLAEQTARAKEAWPDAALSPWGEVWLDEVRSEAALCAYRLTEALKLLEDEPDLYGYYAPIVGLESAALSAFAGGRGQLWDEAREAFGSIEAAFAQTPRLKSFRNVPGEINEPLKAARSDAKDWLKSMREGLIISEGADMLRELADSAPLTEEFCRLLSELRKAYAALKTEAGALDFSDMERLALQLLTAPDGAPSDIARDLSSRLHELMVDEYQDTNGVQDAIFSRIAQGETGFFMVGDVKQCIYRFRGADPSIFLRRRAAYRRAAPAESDGAPYALAAARSSVILKNNFRSTPEVIDSVNEIFRSLMFRPFAETDYGEEEELVFPNGKPALGGAKTEFFCADSPEAATAEAEAAAVAKRVSELLETAVIYEKDGSPRPARPDDIVILLRSMKNHAEVYASALREAGLPADSDAASDFFAGAEIRAALAMLSAISNPSDDVALAGFMRSPLCGFSEDRLAKIRLGTERAGKDASFIASVRACAEGGGAESAECARFLESFGRLRTELADLPLAEAVPSLLSLTGADAVFSGYPGAEARRGNLRRLCELARLFDERGADLRAFVAHLQNVQEAGGREGAPAQGGGGVRIMSVHRSKGLEFPIVILAGTGTGVNERWRANICLCTPELGPCFSLRDPASGVTAPSLKREAAKAVLCGEQLAEELRVIYVALTRARQRLLIYSTECDGCPDLAAPARIAAQMCREKRTPGLWLYAAAQRSPSVSLMTYGLPDEKAEAQIGEAADKSADGALTEQILHRLRWVYPHEAAALLPAKLTATGYKALLYTPEEPDDEPDSAGKAEPSAEPVMPKFLSADGASRLSPTERGVAVHLVMQLLPPSGCGSPEAVRAGLASLTERGVLSPRSSAAVSPYDVARFYASPLGREITLMPTESVHREFKFSILADAAAYFDGFAAGDESLLLQGVVDLFAELPDGTLLLIDYKTDRVAPGAETAERAAAYAPQLSVYARALREITGKAVSRAVLAFLRPGENIEVAL